jgi:hypothetical protein
MSLIYSLKKNKQGVTHVIGDYLGRDATIRKASREKTFNNTIGIIKDD